MIFGYLGHLHRTREPDQQTQYKALWLAKGSVLYVAYVLEFVLE
jgi:hypothetical protein